MAHITIVGLGTNAIESVENVLTPFQAAFESDGHFVEVAVDSEWVETLPRKGLAPSAVHGLRQASGDLILLVDLSRPYTAEDARAVVAPILEGTASVAIGSPGRPTISSRIFAPLARTEDPWSGLVALTREAFSEADGRLRPVGERFALEIAQRVLAKPIDVELPDRPGDRPRWWHFDDIRHLKRLADDRLGMLSRLIQFCVVGASGMVIDLSTYAFMQWQLKTTGLAQKTLPVLGSPLDLAVAGIVSVSIALIWNFSLNRRLTFNDAERRSVIRQFMTYVLSNALAITISLTLRLSLPRYIEFFDHHRLAAAVVGIVASTGVSFAMARIFVFPNESKGQGLENTPRETDRSQEEVRYEKTALSSSLVQTPVNISG
jgi:dolichol-phosphate mannosyltransferase